MTSNKFEKRTVLFYDSCKAHGAYGKKVMQSKGTYDMVVHNIERLEDADQYLPALTAVVLFIYNRRALFQLFPFLNRKIKLILCTNSYIMGWLSRVFQSDITMLDIATPKTELFYQIERNLFQSDRGHTESDVLG